MRTLVHISDLHFGRVDAALLDPLVARIAGIGPDAVVVSGDLTQRARADEFRQARAFLDRLPAPRIVVPGNHDVPLYRVWERFLSPLGKYRRLVDADLEPVFVDDEMAIVSINTARAFTFKGGRINEEQVEAIRRRFEPLGQGLVKVVVTHHPFDLPDDPGSDKGLVGRAGTAMEAFASCGVDLLLAGHLHASQAGDTAGRYELAGFAALAVQAGTATSTRARGEENSFNVLRLAADEITVERQTWRPATASFEHARSERFRRTDARWREVAIVG
ncbi:MAG: metallophosphoesterase family protein [Caldimonas sp.]